MSLPERSWSSFELPALIDPSWSLPESSWRRLGTSRSALRAVLNPPGAPLGLSSSLPERSWRRLEAPMAPEQRFRGPSGSDLSFLMVFRGQQAGSPPKNAKPSCQSFCIDSRRRGIGLLRSVRCVGGGPHHHFTSWNRAPPHHHLTSSLPPGGPAAPPPHYLSSRPEGRPHHHLTTSVPARREGHTTTSLPQFPCFKDEEGSRTEVVKWWCRGGTGSLRRTGVVKWWCRGSGRASPHVVCREGTGVASAKWGSEVVVRAGQAAVASGSGQEGDRGSSPEVG